MAHSWVQMHDSEYEAFRTYCEIYPDNPTLLIDTYNVLESGIPNAIRVFKELGITKGAVRLDSGDIAYLSGKMREMLDAAGLTECKIVASNSLDEYIIRGLLHQGAKVDAFGKVASGSFHRHSTAPNVKHLRWFLNRDSKLYYFYYQKDSEKNIIVLEPSEEMVGMIRKYLPHGAYQE